MGCNSRSSFDGALPLAGFAGEAAGVLWVARHLRGAQKALRRSCCRTACTKDMVEEEAPANAAALDRKGRLPYMAYGATGLHACTRRQRDALSLRALRDHEDG